MITSYAVEAIFSIRDDATSVLTRIGEGLTRLEEQLTRVKSAFVFTESTAGMGELEAQVIKLTDSLDKAKLSAVELKGALGMPGGLTGTIADIDNMIDNAVKQTAARTKQTERFSDPVAGFSQDYRDALREDRLFQDRLHSELDIPPVPRGARSTYYMSYAQPEPVPAPKETFPHEPVANAFEGELAAGAVGAELGKAGFGSKLEHRLFGLKGLTLGAGAYIATRDALQEDLAVHEIENMFGVKDAELDKYKNDLRQQIDQSARGTIYSANETAQGYMQLSKVVAGAAPELLTPKGLSQFMVAAPVMLRSAETMAQLGMGDLNKNLIAEAMYAHLTGRWTADELKVGSDNFMKLAVRTGQDPEHLEATMSQGLPMAQAAGADVDKAAELIGYLSRAGLGRRSGYAVGQMVLGTIPSGQTQSHTQESARTELERLIKNTGETPHSFRQHDNKHDRALREMGLLDAQGKSTVWTGPGGTLDFDKYENVLEAFHRNTKITAEQKEKDFKEAFQVRGLRGASLFDLGSIKQFRESAAELPGIEELQAGLAQSPLYQLEQTWARLKDIGNVMVTAILPGFEMLENILLPVVTAVGTLMSQNQGLSAILGAGSTGAILGYMLGGAKGAMIGAGIGTAIGVGDIAAKNLPKSNWLFNLTPPTGAGGIDPTMPASPFDDGATLPHITVPSPIQKQSYTPGTAPIHIQNINLHGAPHDADHVWVAKIMTALAEAADRSRVHNTGQGWGSYGSPYDAGASA